MFSLVIPTYNEAENVGPCVEAVCRALDGREFEVIIADDDSPDRTWEIARNLDNPRVRVLRRTEDRGLAPAVVDGFAAAQGDRLGVMDADLQHDEAILPEMIDALDTHEFVIGSREAEGGGYGEMPFARRLGSKAAAALARRVLKVPLGDPMSGYFALRREVFERVRGRLDPRGYKIMLEIFCLARPESHFEVGYTFRPRHTGRSKVSAGVAGHYLSDLFQLRRRLREE